MDNKRALFFSVGAFGIAMLLVYAYLAVRENELTSQFGEQIDVVIADGSYFKKDNFIPEYAILDPSMLRRTKVFKNFVQPNTVSDPKDVVGKSTFVPIHKGEQIVLTKLVSQDGKPVLDRQLEKKTRAVTITVSAQSGVGKLIRPGNRVDVLIAPAYDQGGVQIFEVKTLFQNVTVLATGKHIQNEVPTRVDRELLAYIDEANTKIKRKDIFTNTADGLSTSRPDDNYQTVTLQLNTDDAEKLLFLTQKYTDKVVYLTLRNTMDPAVEKMGTTILDDVLGPDSDYGRSKRRAPPMAPPQPKFKDYFGPQEIPRY